MSLYDLIYNFLAGYIFDGMNDNLGYYTIGGNDYNGVTWLNHTITIIILILLIVCLCGFVKWLVKTIGGLIA